MLLQIIASFVCVLTSVYFQNAAGVCEEFSFKEYNVNFVIIFLKVCLVVLPEKKTPTTNGTTLLVTLYS